MTGKSLFSMTPEERAKIMADNPPKISDVFYGTAYFNWVWQGCGFGQLSFSVDKETGAISCMDEHMGRERVRALLHAFADHIADSAVLE